MSGAVAAPRVAMAVATWTWTVAVALWANLIPLEWAYPYCNDPADGPAAAVFGTPLPYEVFADSSMAYAVMPHVYALNTLLVGVPAFLLLRALLGRLARARWVLRGIAVLGLLVAVPTVALQGLRVHLSWVPVSRIDSPPYWRYRDLRPVGLAAEHSWCTPSPFWFGAPGPHAP